MPTNTLACPTPASLGSLDHYIQAVNRFPLLSAEQETELLHFGLPDLRAGSKKRRV